MPTYAFVTVDVFTDTRFGGNQLAVFPDARGLSDAQMQALAAEFNLSETTFVLPPEDPAHTARVRIFNRTAEMPFAGHPNVGTGWVLAQAGRAQGGRLVFEELAGLVEVKVDGAGANIAAPQALSTGARFTPEQVAACAGIDALDVITTAHAPIQASVGVDFVFAEVTAEALTRAQPDAAAFRAVADTTEGFSMRLSLHLYARVGDQIRARMFSPLTGTVEDPATGSANATLGALLLSLTDADEAAYEVIQGVEMGRPSRLSVTARRAPDGVRATVGGGCVPVFKGEVTL
ncbi:PhzF family phenazine biosynthesis protein [Phenylobacterium aquaticum]|uniref:PhzF family phenazine biosynthesis protein n=1 Tax=Phenylobacterium aquaticum TaxID=1763816 RepID=UPI0026EEF897|nr:PhzF family phenazine biosynthesis protein [Phenylobacterium aquaticum]